MKLEKWFLKNKRGDALALAGALCISPTFAKVLVNREINTPQKAEFFLADGLEHLHSASLLKDAQKAKELLVQKIEEKKRIRIIGDYDCDGICATFILWSILKELGAEVDYHLPHRMKDGYGLNISMIEDAVHCGIDTVLTCDNGIAALEQITYAKEKGLTVIVTDHHEVPFIELDGEKKYQLPPADAIVNIKQQEDTYPFKGICGAMIAWKFGQLLLGETHPLIQELIPYAALATVCDVMDLVDENRVLVKEGLRILNEDPPVGLKALIRAYELEDKKISAYHLGFLIGPCLNATGRLETAEEALKLLTMTDMQEAVVFAQQLKTLNEKRKQLTLEYTQKALEQLQTQGQPLDKIIVMYLPDCHESLAGIIAGRIREACHRPTLVFTKSEDGVKASARSMECYDMFLGLSACKDLFTKFGGHKMAAGLSMAKESDIDLLRKRLNEQCTLQEEEFLEKVHIDAVLPLSMTDLALVKELERLEPFGNGNTKPLFAERDLLLLNGRVMGQRGNAARYTVQSSDGTTHQVVFFGDLTAFHCFLDEKFGSGASEKLYQYKCAFPIHMIYTLQINTYQMREQVQIQMKYVC